MRFAIMAASALAASAVVFAVSTARADDASDKKLTVGADLQFVLPVGDMANATGPQIGPIAHVGYRVIPPLEITGRIGYLFGLNKTAASVGNESISTNISNIPIWVGARYFLGIPSDAPAGLYGAAELALNIMSGNSSGSIGGVSASSSSGLTREGFNLGVGYVLSQDLPIDIRLQYSYFNLLGTQSGESSLMGIGLSAGYSFFF